jgi:RNA-directed DNA polymerase
VGLIPFTPSRNNLRWKTFGAALAALVVWGSTTGRRRVRLGKTLHSVIDKVYCLRNLIRASEKVCSNGGSPGLDGMSIATWRAQHELNLKSLRSALLEGRYRGAPVKRVYIPKPGDPSKKRPLGIPDVRERVCQQAVLQQLSPAFEEVFFEDSYGFRPGRSTHTAAHRIEELKRQGYRYVVDLDIENFFGNVDHEILLSQVRKVVKDRRVLGLIRGWLRAGVMEEGKVRYDTSGTPQGGPISPLLSNIYLTPFDFAMKEAGWNLIRYADDVLILCKTQEDAQAALEMARKLLESAKLKLSEAKTKVSSFKEGFDFLGFRFGARGRGVGGKSRKALYEKVRNATKRQQGNKPLQAVIAKVNPIITGWGRYHREGNNKGLFSTLDKWIRNRIRAYKRGRWRDRGRWKIFSTEELSEMGLQSLHGLIINRSKAQLLLF